MSKGITVEYALKFLANNRRKDKFRCKTKYGRSLEPQWGYDKKGHQDEYLRLRDKPFDPILWYK